MLYFATPSGPRVREAMAAGLLGCIVTPRSRDQHVEGAVWCADNGCFGRDYPGDDKWFAWLVSRAGQAGGCAFAVAPDVVGDAEATLARSAPWLPRIRALGYPAALVAQDGLEALPVPWEEFDVLFIGGSTGWKLGPAAAALAAEARRRGKPVHLGRVNSLRRLRIARAMGCDSCDGTYIAFAPDRNLDRMLRFIRLSEVSP